MDPAFFRPIISGCHPLPASCVLVLAISRLVIVPISQMRTLQEQSSDLGRRMRGLQWEQVYLLPKTHVFSAALMWPLNAVRDQLGKGSLSSRQEDRDGSKEYLRYARSPPYDDTTVHDPEPRWESSGIAVSEFNTTWVSPQASLGPRYTMCLLCGRGKMLNISVLK